MKNHSHHSIQIKVAITLKKLLGNSKRYPTQIKNNSEILNSYEKIALAADLRKATVNDIFNANTKSRIVTLIAIVKALGFSMQAFGEVYDSITAKEVEEFRIFKADKEKKS